MPTQLRRDPLETRNDAFITRLKDGGFPAPVLNKIDNSIPPCYPNEAVVQERSLRCAGTRRYNTDKSPFVGTRHFVPKGKR